MGGAQEVKLDMCQFGTPWMKPARLLLWNCRPAPTLCRRCQVASKGGGNVCSNSGEMHGQLSGPSKSRGHGRPQQPPGIQPSSALRLWRSCCDPDRVTSRGIVQPTQWRQGRHPWVLCLQHGECLAAQKAHLSSHTHLPSMLPLQSLLVPVCMECLHAMAMSCHPCLMLLPLPVRPCPILHS